MSLSSRLKAAQAKRKRRYGHEELRPSEQDGEIQRSIHPGFTRKVSKKVTEKLDFKFQFQATKVPDTSWDRLTVSVISLDSGRVTGKTRKAFTVDGKCEWPDAVGSSVKLFLDTKTLQYDEKLFKFVVAKGFSRSCALGEAIINLADYFSASSAVTLTLPLRLCDAGAFLHITIQCLTPKSIDKPFYWQVKSEQARDGHASECESELTVCKAGRSSPVHRLLRTFSVGSQNPFATSASGECSRLQPPSPCASPKKPRNEVQVQAMKCKVYNNPCAYNREEEAFVQASNTGETTTDKHVDTAVGSGGDVGGSFKFLISAFAEDVSNMLLVMRDLGLQGQRELDWDRNQLVEDLERVSHGSQALLTRFQSCKSHSKLASEREVYGDLNFADVKVSEKVLRSNVDMGTARSRKMELDRMQDSNQQLEAALSSVKTDNQRLKEAAENERLKLENLELESKSLMRKVMSLEAEMKVLEEEKEAAFLEKYVGENLARDLCKQVRQVLAHKLPGLESSESQAKAETADIIGQVKQLRTLFTELLKLTQDRERDMEQKVGKLEERVTEENEKALAGISFLDQQFGELSKESDRLIGSFNREVEAVIKRLELERENIKHRGFLEVAFEENACEISYLRNEVRKLQEQVAVGEQNLKASELEESSGSSEESTLTVSFGGQLVNDEAESLKTELATLKLQKAELETGCGKVKRQVDDVEHGFKVLEETFRDTNAMLRDEHGRLQGELERVVYELRSEKTMLDKMVEDNVFKLQSQLSTSEKTVVQLRAELAECQSQKVERSGLSSNFHQRESVLCDKIVQLEVTRKLLEEEVTFRGNESKSLRSALVEKDASCERLSKENEDLLRDWEAQKEELTERIRVLETEAEGLLKMVSSKEAEVLGKQIEQETLRQDMQQKETFLWERIELLETANEQLAFQHMDSDLDQLKTELTRLQSLNSELILREHELSTKLSTYDLLQLELQRLHEKNEQLEEKCSKLKQCSEWADTVERLVSLEAELAEALETNNMYKSQLENLFSKHQESHEANDIDEVIGSLVSFKKRATFLETELLEMQQRYLKMSMKFAELQLEREELIMTVKALRCSR